MQANATDVLGTPQRIKPARAALAPAISDLEYQMSSPGPEYAGRDIGAEAQLGSAGRLKPSTSDDNMIRGEPRKQKPRLHPSLD